MDFATLYPSLASATWRMQIRNWSDQLLLDSDSGDQIYTGGIAPVVTFRWTEAALAALTPGPATYDFGFILPGCDFELAGWGSIAFHGGVTEAAVGGSPSAPTGADDTWRMAGAQPLFAMPSVASAIAAAAGSAVTAAVSAGAAAAAVATLVSVYDDEFPITLTLDMSVPGYTLL